MGFIKDLAITLLQKTSWEKLIVREPDHSKHLEKITQIMGRTPESPPPIPQLAPDDQVSRENMLTYQKKQIYGQLWLLQGHLSNGCRIDDKPCDCCVKHAIALEALASETQPMDPSSIWGNIRNFATSILHKVEVNQVIRGIYASEYPQMAIQARELRKGIELGITSLSLEEAKTEAAKLAAEEVERSWKEE